MYRANWKGLFILLFLAFLCPEMKAAGPAEEIELALSAAPEHLRANAAVYLLQGEKYVRVRDGSNGISCAVLHYGADGSEPICYDREGSRTNMLVEFYRSESGKKGLSTEEIEKKVEEKYQQSEFSAPKRPGVAYMLSDRNYIYNPGGKAFHYPPHVMVFAPYVKNSDIGARKEDLGSTAVPWILKEGAADAYIIVVPSEAAQNH
jgi:hypothetical protein